MICGKRIDSPSCVAREKAMICGQKINYLFVALFCYWYYCFLSRTCVIIKTTWTICANALIVLFISDNILNNTYPTTVTYSHTSPCLSCSTVLLTIFILKVFTTITILLLLKKTCLINRLNRLMLSCNRSPISCYWKIMLQMYIAIHV